MFREKGGGVGTRHQVAGRGILRCAGEGSGGRGGLYTAQIVSWPRWPSAKQSAHLDTGNIINNAE